MNDAAKRNSSSALLAFLRWLSLLVVTFGFAETRVWAFAAPPQTTSAAIAPLAGDTHPEYAFVWAYDGSDSLAAKGAPEAVWNNGWRTLDGKFTSPLGGGQAGAAAEQAVWDAVRQKPGWNVIEGRVSVRNAAGDLRVYDGAAVSPRGRVIGLEVKSGGATRTGAQSAFDAGVNTFNPVIGVGHNAGLEVGRSLLIRVP